MAVIVRLCRLANIEDMSILFFFALYLVFPLLQHSILVQHVISACIDDECGVVLRGVLHATLDV